MASHFRILAWRIPMDRGAWRVIVHGVAKSQTWLSDKAQHSNCIMLYVTGVFPCLKVILHFWLLWNSGYIPCAVHCILVAYFMSNSLYLLIPNPIFPLPFTSVHWESEVCSVCMWVYFFLLCWRVCGIFQASVLEWVAISCSRGSSWPRNQTHVSYVSCIGRRVLYH